MGDDLEAVQWRAGDVDRLAEQADRVHRLDPEQRGGQEFFGGYTKEGRQEPAHTGTEDRLNAEIHDNVVLSEEALRLLREGAAHEAPPPKPATGEGLKYVHPNGPASPAPTQTTG